MITIDVIDIKCELYEKQATLYTDKSVEQRAVLLYFHGGGLLFDNRNDLPKSHINVFCSAGFSIIAFDYPLAPAVKLNRILADCVNSVNYYLDNANELIGLNLPYFLFGRSAGAYLALLTGREKFLVEPRGLISYYGYGLLCDDWYKTPSKHYLTLPKVPDSCLDAVSHSPHAIGDYETHYAVYVYARQSGRWSQLFYEGREKFLMTDYSLRLCDNYPCKLFCAHSSNDTDVPFEEFNALCEKFGVKDKLIVSDKMHDFDRMENSRSTKRLLLKSLEFINNQL